MDTVEKSFTFAQDVTKQVITLSTGIVTLGVAFLKDIIPPDDPAAAPLLIWSWIVYLASIISGIAALLAMTGALNQAASPSIYAAGIRWPSVAQLVLFVLGTALMVWFGAAALSP